MREVVVVVPALASAGEFKSQSVPTLLTYQRQLTNAPGQSLDSGTHRLTFAIHAAPCGTAPSGDTLVWGPQTAGRSPHSPRPGGSISHAC